MEIPYVRPSALEKAFYTGRKYLKTGRLRAAPAVILLALVLSACSPPTPSKPGTSTPRPDAAGDASEADTPTPAASRLEVEEEALRGVRIKAWHPWFGAQASLFESQAAQFNTENQWGIIVDAESKTSFSELFLQTDAALKESGPPQVVIAFPEHAIGWQEQVVDLNAYVQDPLYGLGPAEISDFYPPVWAQDEVDGRRLGLPAQRTARFILYNQSWARELGFDSPPVNSSDFEQQACAAHRALGQDDDPTNDALGGWLIDTDPITSLSWMLAFDGGAQEQGGYRFLFPGNVAAFRYLKTLQQKSCAWVPSPDLPAFDRFAARQALFATAGLQDLPDQTRAFSAAANRDEWTVLAFPGEERDALVLYGSSFILLASDDVTQLASWLFMRWMLSPENQARWVQSTGLFPLRASTLDLLADYAAGHPQWAQAVALLPQGEGTPQLASWRVVRVMLGDGFRDMFDTIRHPDLTEGQVPLILRQMDQTAQDLNQ
ncbi:MAG TPA: extracellular solute-binding protein [Anaerolineales bacterium]|nr:extracellular solute-binding protein [Anaerolineales bacterium]